MWRWIAAVLLTCSLANGLPILGVIPTPRIELILFDCPSDFSVPTPHEPTEADPNEAVRALDRMSIVHLYHPRPLRFPEKSLLFPDTEVPEPEFNGVIATVLIAGFLIIRRRTSKKTLFRDIL